MGFPTINLDKTDLDIEHGVYSVNFKINNKSHSGLMHFGPKKTFGENVSTEVFVKNIIPNLDGNIKVEVLEKIRDVKKFDSKEELKKQIEEDVHKLFLL